MKLALAVVIALGLLLTYFADNIHGYVRFKQLCDTECGLHVAQPLKKGLGWRARKADYSLAAWANVAFVRYLDVIEYDVRYRSGPTSDERSYLVAPADETAKVTYELYWKNEPVPNESRLSRACYEVREASSKALMLRWCQIGYSTFNQDRTLLAAPSGQACHFAGDFFARENQSRYFVE